MSGLMPKVSYLTVTGNRPEFMPWLLWNFKGQTWGNKELIIVDSSEKLFKKRGVKVIHAPGENVPTMRNIAMENATGDFITWLDDDDWRHPESVEILMNLDAVIAGGRSAWFIDLETERAKRFVQRSKFLFANMLIKTELARKYQFDETIERGSDIDWLDRLVNENEFTPTYKATSMFLCHDRNMGNLAILHQFNYGVSSPMENIGKFWGDTSEQLEALRNRLWR